MSQDTSLLKYSSPRYDISLLKYIAKIQSFQVRREQRVLLWSRPAKCGGDVELLQNWKTTLVAKQLVDLNMMMILVFSAFTRWLWWWWWLVFSALKRWLLWFSWMVFSAHKVIMMILIIGIFSSHEVCPIAFSEELTYWGISELFVEPCCQELYYGRWEHLVIVLMSSQTWTAASGQVVDHHIILFMYRCKNVGCFTIILQLAFLFNLCSHLPSQERHDEEGKPEGGGQHLRLRKYMRWPHQTMVFIKILN